MDGRTGWRGVREPNRWDDGGAGSWVVTWVLLATLAGGLVGAIGASAEPFPAAGGSRSRSTPGSEWKGESGATEGTIDFRRALEPTADERQRVLRWHRVWEEETAPLREILGRPGAAEQPARVGDPRWCGALGSAVLAVDRERVFPAPSYGVGARLRRALGSLVRAANACFDHRPYEASFRLAQAHEAFAQAARLLRPYGVAP